MQSHLQNAWVAFIELDYTPEEALERTLTQFGKPHAVAAHWQQEWEKTLTASKTIPVWPSLKLALSVWARTDLAMLALCLLLPVMTLTDAAMPLRGPLILSGFLVPPLISGTAIGLRARRHPLLCTLGGRLLMLPVMIAYLVGGNLWYQYYAMLVTNKRFPISLSALLAFSFDGAMSFLPLWIILSLGSAGCVVIGQRFRMRRQRQTA